MLQNIDENLLVNQPSWGLYYQAMQATRWTDSRDYQSASESLCFELLEADFVLQLMELIALTVPQTDAQHAPLNDIRQHHGLNLPRHQISRVALTDVGHGLQ